MGVRVSQQFVDVLTSEDTDGAVRVTQQFVEVLTSGPAIIPPDPPEPTPVSGQARRIRGKLGCGTWTAAIAARETDRRWEVDFGSLSCERVLDATSRASIDLNCDVKLPGPLRWAYELQLYRDSQLTWLGPITRATHTRDTMRVTASDLSAWWDKRLLEDAFDVTDDLASIFKFVVEQALIRDPVAMQVTPVPTGISGRRINDATGTLRAADLLRELSRTAVDYTVINRDVLVGGVIPGQTRRIVLTDEAFGNPSVESDGDSAASEVVMTGATSDLVARAGGIGPFGLVQLAATESTIADITSLQAAADGRQALLSDDLLRLNGQLTPDAGVLVHELVPGYVFDVRLPLVGKTLAQYMRLTSVKMDVTGGDEKITVNMLPVGGSG